MNTLNKDFVNFAEEKIFNNDILKTLAVVKSVETDDVNLEYLTLKYDNETVSLIPESKILQLQQQQVSTSCTKQQIDELSNFGINAIAQMQSVLVQECKEVVMKETLKKIEELAEASYQSSIPIELRKDKIRKFFYKYFPFLYYFFPQYAPTIYPEVIDLSNHSDIDKNRRLSYHILNASHMIATKCRVGPGDVIITNWNIASMLSDLPEYVASNIKASSVYVAGYIGNIKVIVNGYRNWDDNSITILRASLDEKKPGIVIPYKKDSIIPDTMINENSASKIGVNFKYCVDYTGTYEDITSCFNKMYFKF